MTFWMFILIVALVVFAPRILGITKSAPKAPKPPELKKINFFGGPLDGTTVDVPDSMGDFYVTPYMPENVEDREQIGEVGGQPFYQPAMAFYRIVDDESYFYVRDISMDEVQALASNGTIPDTLGE